MAAVTELNVKDTGARADELKDLEGDHLVVNMGPSHPSTHGVLRIIIELDGETILRADPDIGYLHRGDEKIAENMTWNQFIPYTDRLDYLAPSPTTLCPGGGETDGAVGQTSPPLPIYPGDLLRIGAHFGPSSRPRCLCDGWGAMTVFLHTFTEREKIYNFAEALTGARFTTSYTRIGGVSRDTPRGGCATIEKFCDEVLVSIDDAERLLTRNKIWVDRTKDVGVISREQAIEYGLTGPNLRGSGVDYDVRKANPYLCYKEFDFDIPVGSVGDCYDRYLVRMEEMRQSVRIIRQALKRIPGGFENSSREPVNVPDGKVVLPPKDKVLTSMEELIHQFMLVTQGQNAPKGEVYFGAENPKGELGFYINSRGGGTPYRLKIRAPSFCNLSILPVLLPGNLMSDVVAILGSIDFVMGECDR